MVPDQKPHDVVYNPPLRGEFPFTRIMSPGMGSILLTNNTIECGMAGET